MDQGAERIIQADAFLPVAQLRLFLLDHIDDILFQFFKSHVLFSCKQQKRGCRAFGLTSLVFLVFYLYFSHLETLRCQTFLHKLTVIGMKYHDRLARLTVKGQILIIHIDVALQKAAKTRFKLPTSSSTSIPSTLVRRHKYPAFCKISCAFSGSVTTMRMIPYSALSLVTEPSMLICASVRIPVTIFSAPFYFPHKQKPVLTLQTSSLSSSLLSIVTENEIRQYFIASHCKSAGVSIHLCLQRADQVHHFNGSGCALVPLFPALLPARSMACSMLSVVSTPNITGISLFKETFAMPLKPRCTHNRSGLCCRE